MLLSTDVPASIWRRTTAAKAAGAPFGCGAGAGADAPLAAWLSMKAAWVAVSSFAAVSAHDFGRLLALVASDFRKGRRCSRPESHGSAFVAAGARRLPSNAGSPKQDYAFRYRGTEPVSFEFRSVSARRLEFAAFKGNWSIFPTNEVFTCRAQFWGELVCGSLAKSEFHQSFMHAFFPSPNFGKVQGTVGRPPNRPRRDRANSQRCYRRLNSYASVC